MVVIACGIACGISSAWQDGNASVTAAAIVNSEGCTEGGGCATLARMWQAFQSW